MTFQSMLQVSLNHGDNEGVMFALPAQRLPDMHRVKDGPLPVRAALLKQPKYLSTMGWCFSNYPGNSANNHVLVNIVVTDPTSG